MTIVKYGDPILVTPAQPVVDFDQKLQELVAEMFKTMSSVRGVGLAAPQVGVPLKVAVIEVGAFKIAMCNPKIVGHSNSKVSTDEGCLSLPGYATTVSRYKTVIVDYTNTMGHPCSCPVDGNELLARAIQHEVDHLDGKLFIDRINPARRQNIKGRIRRAALQGKW